VLSKGHHTYAITQVTDYSLNRPFYKLLTYSDIVEENNNILHIIIVTPQEMYQCKKNKQEGCPPRIFMWVDQVVSGISHIRYPHILILLKVRRVETAGANSALSVRHTEQPRGWSVLPAFITISQFKVQANLKFFSKLMTWAHKLL
jgi:hypothetical protein